MCARQMSVTVRAFPLAGAVIAAPAAMLAGLLAAIQGPPLVAALVSLALLAAMTGALHEDGLADAADGLGGGRNAERALEMIRTGKWPLQL